MLTGEDEGETNTNSLVVNEELMYLAVAHAMHTGEDYGVTKTNFLEVNSTNILEVYDELLETPLTAATWMLRLLPPRG